MSRRASLQNVFTKGVLDDKLAERIDLVHFYSGLRRGTNCKVRPQGGAYRREGTRVRDGGSQRIRRCLEPVRITAAMMTAHNGGSTANLADQDPGTLYTTSAIAASPFVVVEVDLGTEHDIAFLDVAGFACATSRADEALAVEYYDGAQWVTFGAAAKPNLPVRRAIRSLEYDTRAAVRCATTKDIDLKELQEIDGVMLVALDRVLVKNQLDPDENGIYVAGAAGWSRADDANAAAELEDFTVYVSEGATQARTWWRQPADKVKVNTTWLIFRRVPGPERTRRFGYRPGVVQTLRYFRVVIYGGVGLGEITLAGVRAWKEQARASRFKPFKFARDEAALGKFVLTDRNLDIFEGFDWVGAVPVPVASDDLVLVNSASSLDTTMLFHSEMESWQVLRQGQATEWNGQRALLANLPPLASATAFSGQQDELQDLVFNGLTAGQSVVLFVGQMMTEPVIYSTAGGWPAALATALQALPGIGAGGISATLISSSPLTVRIAFQAGAGGRAWPKLAGTVLGFATTATVSSTIVRRGLKADGLLMSPETGWPRAGVFHQSRMIVGGFRAAPQTTAATRTGSASDFTNLANPLTADLGYVDTLDTESVETIQQLFVGKHLLALTDTGVWFSDTPAPSATDPRNWRLGARPGIAAGIPVAFTEDAAMYVQTGGGTLRQLLIAQSVQTEYVADPANLLNPRLMSGVSGLAIMQPVTPDDGALVLMPTAGGGLTAMMLLRSQELQALTPWQTATGDRFAQILCTSDNRMWAFVERTAAGQTDVFIELFDPQCILDAATRVTVTSPTGTVAGLGHHEGREVLAYIDGDVYGPLTVTGGAVTLPKAATAAIEIGLATPWDLEPMVVREKLQNGYPFRPPARIYEVGLPLRSTGHLEISVNGGPWRPVALTHLDDTRADGDPYQAGGRIDQPMLERLYSGTITIDKLQGWSQHPRVALRQTLPAPVEVLAVRCEIAHRG